MNIDKNALVTLEFELKDKKGTILDSTPSDEPFEYLHGYSQLVPGLEKALAGKKAGDSFQVVVSPEEGFGLRDESLIEVVDRKDIEDDSPVEVGMEYHCQTPHGMDIITVSKIDGDKVTFDCNHPLAGEELHFDVTVKHVEQATEEQIYAILNHGQECGCGCENCDSDCGVEDLEK